MRNDRDLWVSEKQRIPMSQFRHAPGGYFVASIWDTRVHLHVQDNGWFLEMLVQTIAVRCCKLDRRKEGRFIFLVIFHILKVSLVDFRVLLSLTSFLSFQQFYGALLLGYLLCCVICSVFVRNVENVSLWAVFVEKHSCDW